MMSLKRVAEPVPSPDGKWVLFSAVDVSLEANTKTPHVWAVPAAGGEEREIITAQNADRPRWAPDGKHFLFLSTKEGGSQIWIADFDSSSGTVTGVHKLTSIATEADGPIWSPDGRNILFASNVYPECTDAACNQKKLAESAQTKIKALIFTHLLYRHWNGYKESKRSHLLVIPAAGGASRDAVERGDGIGRTPVRVAATVKPCRKPRKSHPQNRRAAPSRPRPSFPSRIQRPNAMRPAALGRVRRVAARPPRRFVPTRNRRAPSRARSRQTLVP